MHIGCTISTWQKSTLLTGNRCITRRQKKDSRRSPGIVDQPCRPHRQLAHRSLPVLHAVTDSRKRNIALSGCMAPICCFRKFICANLKQAIRLVLVRLRPPRDTKDESTTAQLWAIQSALSLPLHQATQLHGISTPSCTEARLSTKGMSRSIVSTSERLQVLSFASLRLSQQGTEGGSKSRSASANLGLHWRRQLLQSCKELQ